MERLPLGQRIKVGDFWENQNGDLEPRDSVKWFERITHSHAPHYRVLKLYKFEDEMKIRAKNVVKKAFIK